MHVWAVVTCVAVPEAGIDLPIGHRRVDVADAARQRRSKAEARPRRRCRTSSNASSVGCSGTSPASVPGAHTRYRAGRGSSATSPTRSHNRCFPSVGSPIHTKSVGRRPPGSTSSSTSIAAPLRLPGSSGELAFARVRIPDSLSSLAALLAERGMTVVGMEVERETALGALPVRSRIDLVVRDRDG